MDWVMTHELCVLGPIWEVIALATLEKYTY